MVIIQGQIKEPQCVVLKSLKQRTGNINSLCERLVRKDQNKPGNTSRQIVVYFDAQRSF